MNPTYNPFQYLYINEVLSQNVNNIFDEYVQYNDWIEIYNPNNFSVDLNGFYLSNDVLNKQKFFVEGKSDETTILPKGFKILWADKDSTQGKLHLNFSLNTSGDKLFLTAPNGNSIVDSISFGAIPADKSFGREHDADANWITFIYPTPNTTNKFVDYPDAPDFFIYPNPAEQNSILYFSQHHTIYLYDATGRLITNQQNVKQISLNNFAKGLYILRTESGAKKKFVIQ